MAARRVTTAGEIKIVRLLIEHPHNGKTWPAGARLAVSLRLGNWWIAQGIAKESPLGVQAKRPRPMVRRGGCNCGRGWNK